LNFRLTKRHRLLKSGDFKHVFDGVEIKAGSRHLAILGCTTDLGHARFGLVISKKNAGIAVQRNRLKRLGREVFRHRNNDLPSIDMVLIAKHGVSSLSNPAILNLLNGLVDTLIEQHKKHLISRDIPANPC
jgi:ribonuclease P protein component